MALPATMQTVNPQAATAVVVAASERTLRDAMLGTLAPAGFCVATSPMALDALTGAISAEQPAAVVLAGKRIHGELLDRVRSLRDSSPDASIVLVAERTGNGDVRKALDAGAAGVIPAARVTESLVATVQAVLAGLVAVPQEAREDVNRPVLTTREKQILGLVTMGLSNSQIASKLYLAESTVKSHLSSAFGKLGVSSRNEAVAMILDEERRRGLGILTIPAERITATI